MFIKQYLYQKIKEKTNFTKFVIEKPKKEEHGDYATNLAFILAKENKQNPNIKAKELAEMLCDDELEAYAIGPFINFKFNKQFLSQQIISLEKDLQDIKIGNHKEKILLEFVSANPTGPLHVGHGRWAIIGDVLKRAFLFLGYDVASEFYINDAGNQIDKFLESINAIKKGIPIPEDGYHGNYVYELAKLEKDPVLATIDKQKEVLASINVNFDNWFSEQELHLKDEVVKIKLDDMAYQKDGAFWFQTTLFGDDKDRVIFKKDGNPTYFATDIAYHKNKLTRGFKKLINILGADHHGYVKRMQAGLASLLKANEAELIMVIGQLVNLLRNGSPVRMSKRTGEIITLEEVVKEIGSDAFRYFMARYNPDSPIDFDLDIAKLETLDNPVYYVQYAYARICNILKNAQEMGIDLTFENKIDYDFTIEKQENKLLRKLLSFGDEILEAVSNLQTNKITSYAEELASDFHNFYHNCRVISDDLVTSKRRLFLTQKTKFILKLLLENILAIKAPHRM